MPTHYIDAPLSSGIRFVPVDLQVDARYNFVHLDNDWFVKTILWFEEKVKYYAKWQQNDITTLQFKSTVGPLTLKVLNEQGKIIEDNINIPVIATSIVGQPWQVYQKVINFSAIINSGVDPLPPGNYYLFITAGSGGNIAQLISEPIQIKLKHVNTVLIEYKHDENDYDVIWEVIDKMQFRVEAIINQYKPKVIRNVSEDQTRNITTTSAVPYRKWKFRIGENRGVPPWVPDKLNFVFCCRSIWIDGLLMAPDNGAELEDNNIEGYPMQGWQIDMREGKNIYSNRIFTGGNGAGVIVVTYNINQWTWYSPVGQNTSTNVLIEKIL
jgi:hypothetical protein